MRIALDAFEAGFEPLTGTGRYVRGLLGALNGAEITAFLRHGHGVKTGAAKLVALRCPVNRTVWSQARLPLALAMRRPFDVLHVPGHKLPALAPCKTVVTIHDLAFLKFPETFKPLHRQRLVWFTRNAVRRADRIIAVSESTKRDLCELLGAPDERIDVVHHGVDHELFRPDVAPAVRTAPYILSVGTLQPRKNYTMLIRAFKRLCERRREPVELLIAGQRGWLWEEIEAEADRTPRVHLLGYVSDDQLPALYAGAAVVAMPSLYEGFGLPLLEAMACEAPVVAANVSCFPEVVGNAAVMLDPTDEESWAATLSELLDDPAQRESLRQNGMARAKEFTWERTASQTLVVYRKAAAG
ncbi:MAG: glycosyltransferase family 1 protein [Verrucomicrobiia bacterium]|jgi:glycosyltransferase involved in cell wall biosynthesis